MFQKHSYPGLCGLLYSFSVAECATILPGTDNNFCAEDLLPRWAYTTNEFAKRGITVLSFGTDGDSRLTKCMKISSSFEPSSHSLPTNNISSTIPTIWENWFHIQPINSICTRQYPPCCQIEEPFIEAKYCFMDGRLQYTASGSHLHVLTIKFQKDQHAWLRDINHKGKQNFQAVVNITAASHLLPGIPQSDATKCYTELIKCAMDSFF